MVSTEKINAAVARHLPDSVQFLSDIIKYPSVSGQEHELMLFLEKAFASGNTKIERVPLSDKIKNDPDYCDPVPGIKYDGRFNLRLSRKGSGNGRTLLFNTHTDVVPASEGMHDAWSPRVSDGFVFGRGACDAKG